MSSVASGRYFKSSPARLELLRRLRRAEGLEAMPDGAAGEIRRRDDSGKWPLSFSQERLWFLARLEPDGSSLVIPLAVRLRGRLDAGALARGLTGVCRRHEVLRAVFTSADGRPEQRIAPPRTVALPRLDLGALTAAARRTEEERLARCEALRPFRLDRGPLLRALLVARGEDDHVLHLAVHHIVADGWSLGILVRELVDVYAAGTPALAELPIQYADYASWQRRRLAGEQGAADLAYWRRQLAGVRPTLELPADRPRPAVQTYRGGRSSRTLDPERTEALRALAGGASASLFMALLAGFQLLLARWSGEDDVVVGSPIAGRTRRELEGLVGLFLNHLVLRADLSGNPAFRELLSRVRQVALEAYAHQEVPFELLLEELQAERDLGRTPLFQVYFNMLNFPGPETEVPGLAVEGLGTPEAPSKFDMTLYVSEDASGGLRFELVYNADLFGGPRMEELLAQYELVLAQAAAAPETPVGGFSLLTAAARSILPDPEARLDDGWPGPIHEAAVRRARETPDRTAVTWESGALSYGRLEAESRRLALRLREGGVGRGDVAAVWAARDPALPAAVLGVLRSGAAFLLLDPAHPAARHAACLRQARPRGWVTLDASPPVPDELEQAVTATVTCRTGRACRSVPGDESPPGEAEPTAGPADLACVSFTSGSTGEPKGVLGLHRSLTHFLPWQCAELGLGAGDRFSLLSGLSHDPLQRELFTAWWLGAAVAVPDPARLPEPGWLAGWMADAGVTVAHLTPALGQVLCEAPAGRGRRMPELRRALFVGEALRRRDVERLRDLAPRVECVNLYGTTETQRAVAYHRTTGGETAEVMPLGRGMPGVQLLVTRRRGAGLAGVAELGEVLVRSPHLAAGYLGDAKLTARRFTANPFGGPPGDRVYRTGDLGRYRPDGEVDFAGRGDRQVQVRGFRVEPGEIEAALVELEAVRRAAVLAREEADGEGRLVAYVVASGERPLAGRELAELLRRRLPAHMVPAVYVPLDELPVTPNRKVDRAALARLPLPEAAREPPERAATPVEEVLAGIWREVLTVKTVAPDDDFFALGGHSLKVTQALARIAEAFDVELPVRSLFEAPTLAALARRIEEGGGARKLPPLTAAPGARDGLPLSFAQQRLLFLDRLTPGSPAYNVPAAVRLRGPLSPSALERALREEARRQEVLRTTFGEADGRPVARIRPAVHEPLLPRVDLAALPAALRQGEAERRVRDTARAPFDLQRGPLWRARLVRLADDDHVVVLTLHHAITDAWSMSVLVREVAALYGSARLPALAVQYADFALWQRRWLRGEVLAEQLAYWRRRLEGLEPLELATDRPRGVGRGGRAGRLPLRLPASFSEELRSLARGRGATLFMALLAGFQALLARSSHQPRPAVGTPIANRRHPELEGLVGFFANTLVLAADLAGDPPFEEVLRRAREVALGAYTHQDLPFEKLVEELKPERDRSRPPLFQVMLALDNVPAPPSFPGGLAVTPLAADAGAARFDLSLRFIEGRDGLAGFVDYAAALFDGTTVARLAGHLRALLAAASADPRLRLAELPLASAAERHQLAIEWSGVAARLEGASTPVHELVAAQTGARPEAAAVVDGEAHLSYCELAARAGRLARRLRALGVGPDECVGICLERSAEAVVAVLAVPEAGGAWVPLDPEHPAPRLAELAEQARIRVIVTTGELRHRCPVPETTRVLDVERGRAPEGPPPGPGVHPAADHLAYVYFTSGSTGRPKGVMISHRAMADRFAAAARLFAVGPGDRQAQAVAMSFDPFVHEVYLALAAGGRLVVVRRHFVRSGGLERELVRHAVTAAKLTPSLLAAIDPGALPALATLGVGGERCPADLARRWARGRRLLHTYGPTEITVCVTAFEMAGSPPLALPAVGPPIGRPLSGSRAYVLGPRLEPMAAGAPGELLIGGAGLARGYHGQGAETAARFVPDPVAEEPGGRLYRTGDRVRWLFRGHLEFLGRLDRQVKVRGVRIEPGEIEAVLLRHPRVKEAAVVDLPAAGGQVKLTAYYAAAGGAPPADELRAHLAEHLPAFMVPAAFAVVEALPRKPSGKLDRAALPSPAAAPGGTYRAPSTTTEAQLAILWAEVLEHETAPDRRIGVDDDFFELGGHSLAALRLFSRIREVFGVEPALEKLFDLRTIAGLAGELERLARGGGIPGAAGAAGGDGPLVRIQPGGSKPPLFFVHPGGGEVLCYAQLARALGPEQPFFGLQSVGLKGEREPLESIEDMAEVYLGAVRGIQPSGPYRLGGWSFGGNVAFEMAGRLEREGERVELLALLDTVLRDSGPDVDDAELLAEALGEMFEIDAGDLRRLEGEEAQLAYLLERGREAGRLPQDFHLDQARQIFRVYKANVRAARRHRPRPQPVRATLFRAAVSRIPAGDPAGGWGALATGGVEVLTVPGTHHEMIFHPYVDALAASLGRRLGARESE